MVSPLWVSWLRSKSHKTNLTVTATTEQVRRGIGMTEPLQVGTPAPDVTFRQGREQLRLADSKGQKNVVVAFYAAAFSGG